LVASKFTTSFSLINMPAITQTISLNLKPLSDNDLLNYAHTLVSGLPTVGAYSTVQPTVAEGSDTIRAYATATANAAKGGELARMLRDDLRGQVEEIIRDWSDFALTTTPDDPLQWVAAHFRLTKGERTPRLPLTTPTKFVAADGPIKGSIELRQNAQAGAKAYVYEYAAVPAEASTPAWQYCLGTTATCVVSGLVSGQQYLFRAAAWNGLGEMPYSVTEARYVQ
jgi:hypothetical protein